MGKKVVLHWSKSAPHGFMSELINGEITMKEAERRQRQNAVSLAEMIRRQGRKARMDSHIETCTRYYDDGETISFTGRVYMVHESWE